MTPQPHVVILGGGFGGLQAARALARVAVRVTLIDRRNHHLFQPLLYQVATAGLSAVDIAAPIRRVLRRQANATVLLAEAQGVDPVARKVVLDGGEEVSYDFLIVATGATHSYFGHDEWSRFAPGLKKLEDALEIRRRVLLAYEHAERETDPERRKGWLTFAVIGGGPTGVELAGALCEIARRTLVRNFRRFNPADARVLLLEAAPQVLGTYPPDLQAKARRQLERLGVEVLTGKPVTRIDEAGVQLGEELIATHTVLWAAGVAASSLGKDLGAPLDRVGRVLVAPDLSVPGHPEVLVIGDLAHLEQEGKLVPGVAPAAIQMGRHAARHVRRALAGQPGEPFRYRDKGSMATIGRKAAVAVMGRLHLSGFAAWAAWLLVHIFFLIGFRNRFVVFFEWAWAYLTYQRSARVILQDPLTPRRPGTGTPQ